MLGFDGVKNDAFFKYKALAFTLFVFVPACNGGDYVDIDDDTATAEVQDSLKANKRTVSLFSDTAALTLQSYGRAGKNNYTLDLQATCAAGEYCEFTVNRASINDVVGVKLGDWRPSLAMQAVGFDGCNVTCGDFGQGQATRGSCHVEDLEVNASASFTWQ